MSQPLSPRRGSFKNPATPRSVASKAANAHGGGTPRVTFGCVPTYVMAPVASTPELKPDDGQASHATSPRLAQRGQAPGLSLAVASAAQRQSGRDSPRLAPYPKPELSRFSGAKEDFKSLSKELKAFGKRFDDTQINLEKKTLAKFLKKSSATHLAREWTKKISGLLKNTATHFKKSDFAQAHVLSSTIKDLDIELATVLIDSEAGSSTYDEQQFWQHALDAFKPVQATISKLMILCDNAVKGKEFTPQTTLTQSGQLAERSQPTPRMALQSPTRAQSTSPRAAGLAALSAAPVAMSAIRPPPSDTPPPLPPQFARRRATRSGDRPDIDPVAAPTVTAPLAFEPVQSTARSLLGPPSPQYVPPPPQIAAASQPSQGESAPASFGLQPLFCESDLAPVSTLPPALPPAPPPPRSTAPASPIQAADAQADSPAHGAGRKRAAPQQLSPARNKIPHTLAYGSPTAARQDDMTGELLPELSGMEHENGGN